MARRRGDDRAASPRGALASPQTPASRAERPTSTGLRSWRWLRRGGLSRSARVALALVAVLVYSSSGVPLPSYAATPTDNPVDLTVTQGYGGAVGGSLVSLSAPERVASAEHAVLFVHGWLSTSLPAVGDADPGVAQSPFARRPASAAGSTLAEAMEATRSLQDRIEALPGTTLYAFDYSQTAAAWVGGAAVIEGLARAIRQLAAETSAPVDVIGHSMGGLALRYAVAAHPDLIELIGQVVTVGTPTLGSDAAELLDALSLATGTVVGAGSAARALIVPALVDLCNRDLAIDAKSGCGLPTWLRTSIANTGEAGRALHVGSEELTNLPAWPHALDVHAIAGDARLSVADQVVSFGDGLVSRESATAQADSVFVVRCETRITADLAGLGRLLRGEVSIPMGGGDCAHDDLFGNPDVVANIVDVLTGDPSPRHNPRIP
ncbi:esterase/lipase family protein [Microbacterium sp. NPDC058021]|uniref:esterase/lipase family protein n=1 Tax=Microbacterium sp. NPDC058021 TaxID=3346306 RepID=UPI0036DEC531